MQTISDDMLTTLKICVAFAKYERALNPVVIWLLLKGLNIYIAMTLADLCDLHTCNEQAVNDTPGL